MVPRENESLLEALTAKDSLERNGEESIPRSLALLVWKSRRRYGGYIVHVGIAVMMIGFAGRAWSVDKEASLKPGESVTLEEYTMTYVGPRMEVDAEKRPNASQLLQVRLSSII